MEENTSILWNKIWKNQSTTKEDRYYLLKEENSVRWNRIQKIVLKEFGSFKDLNVIEIGAGVGTNDALMAKRGARVTILDYSENALKRARLFFSRNGLTGSFIKVDALDLPKKLLHRYDISMSFGLTEHFKGFNRFKINKSHFDLLKEGGITFIAVPHVMNFPYRLFKFITQKLGFWKLGEEYPYSKQEFIYLCKLLEIEKYSFFGDSLLNSFEWINPIKIIKSYYQIKPKFDINPIKREIGTFLDKYLSYSLVFMGKK